MCPISNHLTTTAVATHRAAGSLLSVCLLAVWVASSVAAQDEPLDQAAGTAEVANFAQDIFQIPAEVRTFEEETAGGKRWLLLICGLPGDEEHRERLTDATRQLATDALTCLGVSPACRRVLAGDEQMLAQLQAEIPVGKVTERDSLESTCAEIAAEIAPQDSLWVIVLGHANISGRNSLFNIQGPDIHQQQFADWAGRIQCRQKVFFITIPVSAFWLRPLAGPNTVCISATGAAMELTGTEMPYALADVLSGLGRHQRLEDIDEDHRLSLLDLYFATNVEIAARFAEIERLATEHALLDDDGDGRGRELQADYLPADPLDPAKRGRRKITRASIRDGRLASQILIAPTVPPAVELLDVVEIEEAEEESATDNAN